MPERLCVAGVGGMGVRVPVIESDPAVTRMLELELGYNGHDVTRADWTDSKRPRRTSSSSTAAARR